MEDKKNKENKESSIRQILAGTSGSSKKKIKIKKKSSSSSDASQSKSRVEDGNKKPQFHKQTRVEGQSNGASEGKPRPSYRTEGEKPKDNAFSNDNKPKKYLGKEQESSKGQDESTVKPISPFHPRNDRNPIISRPPKAVPTSPKTDTSGRPKQQHSTSRHPQNPYDTNEVIKSRINRNECLFRNFAIVLSSIFRCRTLP